MRAGDPVQMLVVVPQMPRPAAAHVALPPSPGVHDVVETTPWHFPSAAHRPAPCAAHTPSPVGPTVHVGRFVSSRKTHWPRSGSSSHFIVVGSWQAASSDVAAGTFALIVGSDPVHDVRSPW